MIYLVWKLSYWKETNNSQLSFEISSGITRLFMVVCMCVFCEYGMHGITGIIRCVSVCILWWWWCWWNLKKLKSMSMSMFLLNIFWNSFTCQKNIILNIFLICICFLYYVAYVSRSQNALYKSSNCARNEHRQFFFFFNFFL